MKVNSLSAAARSAHLGDPKYWGPYVTQVLLRHELPTAPLESPFVGTFPTFLAGDLVVKLFGEAFDGTASHGVVSSMPARTEPRLTPTPRKDDL